MTDRNAFRWNITVAALSLAAAAAYAFAGGPLLRVAAEAPAVTAAIEETGNCLAETPGTTAADASCRQGGSYRAGAFAHDAANQRRLLQP